MNVKCLWALLLGICLYGTTYAQGKTGYKETWYGVFKTPVGEKQRLEIILEKENNNAYKGWLKVADTDAEPIPLQHIEYRGDSLRFELGEGNSYSSSWDPVKQQFNGKLLMFNESTPLALSRKEIKKEDLYKRPQEPKPPFNYYTEEVSFVNPAGGTTLAGTFTRPDYFTAKYPVVIMISDAGARDRNNEIAGHKPFLVMADYLARNGIAVLRYDSRGTGKSTGDYDNTDIFDLAKDVQAAISFIKTRKDVDTAFVGLLGLGQGANVAQIVAAGDPSLAFVVSMAGTGISGRQMIDLQWEIAGRSTGASTDEIKHKQAQFKAYFDLLATESDMAVLEPKAVELLKQIYQTSPEAQKAQMSEEDFVDEILNSNLQKAALSMMRYKPLPYLQKIKCPFLAINGTLDVQVDANVNLPAIERALTENGNMKVTIRKFEGLNHLFQRCNTCTFAEYGELEQTISPMVLEFITHWIQHLPAKTR
jgi:pimeloyl-ACP methyl ester carboxylesterase